MIIEVKVPSVGESVNEVTLASWLVKDGDMVQIDQSLCELESDKASMELPAEKAGKIKIIAATGSDLGIGALLATIDTAAASAAASPKADSPAAPPPTAPAPPPAVSGGSNYAGGHPSPAAAKLIAENQVTVVQGTGKDGRITKEDAQKAIEQKNNTPAPPPADSKATPPPAANDNRAVRREKMSRLRRTIAAHLVEAKNTTAMLTTFNEVDLTEIMAVRAKYKDIFKEKHQVGLGFMSFFTKACCVALLEFPPVNAQINGDDIVYHDFVDISVAVSTPRGLVTPVVRNAHAMNLEQIEKAIGELAVRGRDNKLGLDDMEGGTFTISNGGVFGSLLSTPIINAPQTAILGMHKIQDRPMVINGEIKVRPMMYLALSYDHRIIDGKEAVSFLVRVKELLEDPIRLMLGV
ncbi:MAG: 2-oxoglutarate dehydrogenase complex dihydrolipoyllysine-residue succinyltransferase [Sphingobacteriales bacterium]|nr:2-oxoglutarate dehydrogenase complex dihydrolipoyllysine-residue succinyltransferase [Sphingobacteriales bacterium]